VFEKIVHHRIRYLCYPWFNIKRNTLHVYNTQHIYEPRISDLQIQIVAPLIRVVKV
jgi:hypothetical protein